MDFVESHRNLIYRITLEDTFNLLVIESDSGFVVYLKGPWELVVRGSYSEIRRFEGGVNEKDAEGGEIIR